MPEYGATSSTGGVVITGAFWGNDISLSFSPSFEEAPLFPTIQQAIGHTYHIMP